jgi:hypothetical protein
MSEKQTHNPEASTQTKIEVYRQAANYLETAIAAGTAKIEPALYSQVAMLKVSAEVAELNGKKITLEYDRPASPDDMMQVDKDIPLAWTDDQGRNHWQTPINVKVISANGPLLRDYDVEYAGRDEWARVTNLSSYDDGSGEYGGITQLDASEVIAQLEWGLENFPPQD